MAVCGRVTWPRQRSGTHRGFTLIEVVIALAIFVIGAVAIVRIFAPALGVIQNSGNRTIAMRSTQSVLARNTTQALGTPDWIYDGTGALDARTVQTPVEPIAFNGSINKNNAVPRYAVDISDSALAHYKHIVGERQRVLFNTTTSKNFVVTNFPYSGKVSVGSEDFVDGVKVVDDEGHITFGEATLRSTGITWAAADGFSPAQTGPNHCYYISYRWIDNAGFTHGVTDEPYVFPGPFSSVISPGAQLLQGRRRRPATPLLPLPNRVVQGEVSVRVVKTMGDADVAVAGDNIRGIATDGLLVGLAPGTNVYLSYDVLDWRWMVDDNAPNTTPDVTAMPAPAAPETLGSINLPVRGLGFSQGDTTTGAWVYTALMPAPSSNKVALVKTDYWDGASANSTAFVNDKSGQVIFKYDTSVISAPRVRTAYKSLDGWAQQLSVAPKTYVPFVLDSDIQAAAPDAAATRPTNAVRQAWREYYWDSAAGEIVYFRGAEAGKTIVVTYAYRPVSTEPPVVKSEVLTIDDDIDANVSAFSTTPVTKTTLSETAVAIIDIQGLSIQARTAWIEAGRYTQVVATGYRH